MPAATWIKGKKRIKGVWSYSWNKDRFVINIFKRCPISGQSIEFQVSGDTPEFNGWKLEKKDANVPAVQVVQSVSNRPRQKTTKQAGT